MNAIKNQSMLKDERLSYDEYLEKYGSKETSVGHIMTKLVDEGVYKVEEVLRKKWPLYYDEEVNKVIFDLYKLLEGSGIRENFGNIFSIARTQDFFNYEASFRFINGIFGILKEKFLNGEIEYDTWVRIIKEFKNEDGLDLYYELIDNQEFYEKQREINLKIKGLWEKVLKSENPQEIIRICLIKYGYKEENGVYKYDDGEKENIFGRIPEELKISDIKRFLRGIEYILESSYEEAISILEDFIKKISNFIF